MRALCFVLCLFALPASAAAQHSFSLPPIGGPLPSIGLRSAPWEHPRTPSWERPQVPVWERKQLPPWERSHVVRQHFNDRRRSPVGFLGPQVVYVMPAYPLEMQQPQIVIVERPVTRIVEVEVPARREPAAAPPPPREPEPPFVPTGDRTLYVIPGCYVGNVPPKDVKLPATCDLAKLTTFSPSEE